ncbi:MAG: nuclear transport factor 2 family protein [Rhizomicrobium sp.]
MLWRILICAILLAGGAATAAPLCAAGHDARTEAAVLHVEDLWVRALQSKDVDALACILAPGFGDAAWNGEVWTREQVLKALPRRAPNVIHLGAMKAHVEGNIAVVHGVNTMTKPDGKRFAVLDFTDMFKYRNGRWQAVGAQETLRR